MKLVLRLVMLAALIALGVWLWTIFFPSPEKVIRKRLAEVARLASFAPDEGLIPRAANIQKLASYFDSEVTLTVDWRRGTQQIMADRDEMTQLALAIRSNLRSLKVQLLDLNVMLAADKQSAVVELTARASAPAEPDFLIQEMKFTLKKVDNEWLISRIETVRTLTRVSPHGTATAQVGMRRTTVTVASAPRLDAL
ncbi:MAG: hypothetical protein KIS67_20935 [Verrucomicrobiae bacterium]|nr:hypothetical protein [Verrucomicrobiae bacterium]